MGNPWFNMKDIDFTRPYKLNETQNKRIPAANTISGVFVSFLYQGGPEHQVSAEDLVGETIWVQDRSEEIIFSTEDLHIPDSIGLSPNTTHVKIIPRFLVYSSKGDSNHWILEVFDTTSEIWWLLDVLPLRDELSEGLWTYSYNDAKIRTIDSNETYWKPYKILRAIDSPTKSVEQIRKLVPSWNTEGISVPLWSSFLDGSATISFFRPAMINFENESWEFLLNWNTFPTSLLRGVSS